MLHGVILFLDPVLCLFQDVFQLVLQCNYDCNLEYLFLSMNMNSWASKAPVLAMFSTVCGFINKVKRRFYVFTNFSHISLNFLAKYI